MKYLQIFAILLAINLVLWGLPLSKFVLNGDDLVILTKTSTSLDALLSSFVDFSAQYRPLGLLFYNLYKPVQYNFNAIYALHLILFTTVEFLFYVVIRKYAPSWKTLIFTACIFANPILYYHIFTIAADINLEIIFLLLGMVLLIQRKQFNVVVALFLVSLFLKETFILLTPLLGWALYQSSLKIKAKALIISSLIIALGLYGLNRVARYQTFDENYAFIFTLEKAKDNVSNMGAWLIGHPRGPQFGWYGFRNIGNYVIDLLWVGLWLIGVTYSVLKKRVWTVILLACLVLSLVPFVFLNRTLVFYMDVPLIILGLLLASTLKTKMGPLVLSSLVLVTLLSYFVYFTKWVNYSFVGNANLLANNFVSATKDINWTEQQSLCIINHSLGVWATENGRLLYYAHPNFKGSLYSIPQSETTFCPEGLILQNDGANYYFVDQIR